MTPAPDTSHTTCNGLGEPDSEVGELAFELNNANPTNGEGVSLEQLLGLDIDISDSNPRTVGHSSPRSRSSRTLVEPSTALCHPGGQDDTAISLSSGNDSTSWDALSSDSSDEGSCDEDSLLLPDDD